MMTEFENMVQFLDDATFAKDQIVPCLCGPAGIGKTAAVHEHAKNVGAGKVVTIIASQILPNEVSGITMPVHETRAMEIYDHFRLSSLEDGDILFFDELLEADQLVLSACLTLIESRQMMSGNMLPDIQIIAATNPTIKPEMLKENIRQRFVFRRFDIDRYGCAAYIAEKYGIVIEKDVLNQIVETGDEYNILTPRSLTKMAHWICQAKDCQQAQNIADQISQVWSSNIGSSLYRSWREKFDTTFNNPREQFRKIVLDAFKDGDLSEADDVSAIVNKFNDDEVFNNTSMSELVEMLQSLEGWETFEKFLINMPVEEEDEAPILF